MKKIICSVIMGFLFMTASWGATQQWENWGNLYFLTKNTRENFAALGAGANKFSNKYLAYDGVDFLVKGADDWQDYGRLNLGNNNMFLVPVRCGMKVEAIHFLASGNYGNSYEHDSLLRLYGENYYYSVLTVTFAYQDGTYKILSAPVFWDWFHLPSIAWAKDGVTSKAVGVNPVRRDCTMYHISFANPRPTQPVKNILVSDSWLSDRPFSDVFALTVKSSDTMPAIPKKD
ncbi:MAG: hypothetical protein HQL12_06065 [Candidatus Omnitrophica bacterium]|nr:hypothetical protein [Candidatus Omnitrophota bacterium]